jgi:putative FmdB family regulatory protein
MAPAHHHVPHPSFHQTEAISAGDRKALTTVDLGRLLVRDYNRWLVGRYFMPLYTYRCDNCGIQFDRRQHFNDKPLVRCPECGAPALRKLYQPVGIVFKGSGFYATDHRSPSGQTKSTTPSSERGDGQKKDKKSTSKQPKQKTEKSESASSED